MRAISETNRFGTIHSLITLVLTVFSDQSLGLDCVEDPREAVVHAKSNFHACPWGYSHVWHGRSCHSPKTTGYKGPQRVSSFNTSIRRNRSTRNLLA
jgi:hypothetical protein